MRELFVDVAIVERGSGRESDQGEVESHIHRDVGAENGILNHPAITAEGTAAEERGKGEEGKIPYAVVNSGIKTLCVQWNLANLNTSKTVKFVPIKGLSSFQEQKFNPCLHLAFIINEVSAFQKFKLLYSVVSICCG